MVREIQIGEKEVKFGASGALPIIYRDLTGRDFFADMQSMSETVNSTILDIAWAMHKDAEPESAEDQREWLRRFDFMDINSAIPEIVELLSDTQKTTSEVKKKSDR